MSPSELAGRWRQEADLFERRGALVQARLLRSCADDLGEAITEHELELLNLDDAVVESRYTRSALEKMMKRGDLPNAGGKGSPRIRRCDLPRKPGSESELVTTDDIVAAVRASRGS